MQLRRVVITGIGLITPVGNTTEENWQRICAGVSGIKAIPADWNMPDGFAVKSVGLVSGEQEYLDRVLDKKLQARTDRFIHLGLIAGNQALADAGILDSISQEQRGRIGALIGVGIGGLAGIQETVRTFDAHGASRVSPLAIPKLISNMASAWLCMQHNLQGPNMAVTSACASSTDAVGLAFDMIRLGRVDAMLSGGAEACALPMTLAAFANMRALSTWQGAPEGASRPFDKDRSGFVLSEGGAVLVLEELEHARARGAQIYAEVVGYGATADAYHMTAMHPDARGAEQAVRAALADAQISPEKIDYINAHGTSTPMNDPLETTLIKRVFSARAHPSDPGHLLVSSTKSMTGHMLGATGAAELGYTALALHNQLAPPTINCQQPAEGCDLDYVVGQSREARLEYALSQSFGFGGSNSAVVLKRFDE